MQTEANGQVAIITGGSRGIGRGIAVELGKLGMRLIVNYVNRADAAEETLRLVRDAGGDGLAVQANVAELVDHRKLIDAALDRYGRLDVLVNNAGITSQGRKDILEATEESWDLVFAVNLKGPFFLTQAVAREMQDCIRNGRQESGTIINISSISAFTVSVNRADYCMTKAAMGMMTKLFAQRLAESNIRVYEIQPGVIESDMTAPVKEKYDRLIAEGLWPIRRWGTPKDVGLAVRALVSGEFPFSTGEQIRVDGGFHIRTL
ncbi:3-ketoacyl-ACP reductase [Thermostilla marina]